MFKICYIKSSFNLNVEGKNKKSINCNWYKGKWGQTRSKHDVFKKIKRKNFTNQKIIAVSLYVTYQFFWKFLEFAPEGKLNLLSVLYGSICFHYFESAIDF